MGKHDWTCIGPSYGASLVCRFGNCAPRRVLVFKAVADLVESTTEGQLLVVFDFAEEALGKIYLLSF